VLTRNLPRGEWDAYFGAFAVEPGGGGSDEAILYVEPPPDGGEPAARRLHLEALTYEPADELFEVAAAGLRHFVLHPAAVLVDDETGRLRRLEFVFRNGASETLVLN
jgi:hypothetical protein